MNIASFLESLKNPLVIIGLSIFILLVGWVVSRWIAKLIVGLLKRTHLTGWVTKSLKLQDASGINRLITGIVRFVVIFFSAWGAWSILNLHSDISRFITRAGKAISRFVRLPAVIFIFDLFLVAIATLVLFKVFGWVKAGFSLVAGRIESEREKSLKGFKFQKVEVFTASQLTSFLLGVNKYIRYGVNVLLFLIYLTGVFSVFPQTRGVVMKMLTSIFGIVQSGFQGLVDYLPSLLNLIVIIVVTYYLLKVMHFVFHEIEKGTIAFAGFHADWAIPTYQMMRFVVIAFALVVAFPYLPGSGSPAFQGVSVFVGLLFSLGSTSVIANIVSGVVLTYTRSFRVGDRVKIADTVGDIIEKGLLVTRIRTIKNVEITIPNSMVMGSHIINYSTVSQEHGLILNTTVTLGYDIPWRLIHETLIKAAQTTPGILPEPRPFVLQTSLDDSYVSYELNAYTNQPNRMAVIYSELHQNMQDCCNEAGIEILSPLYGAIRDGNPSTIPADYLPKDYKAPPFNIRVQGNGE